jgi:hypothetical protein
MAWPKTPNNNQGALSTGEDTNANSVNEHIFTDCT